MNSKPVLRVLGVAALALLIGAIGTSGLAAGLPSSQVRWVSAASDADIGGAFAKARAENKPVLLYWGATWCPPCNQLKATLFNRQDFAALSKSFVAVHVDGDRPGAQKLGQRFNVRGYPTLVLLKADGSELTRLPGEVEASQVLELLQQGLSGGRPVKAVLADWRAAKPISAAEWRALAFYSFETDGEQLLGRQDAASLLAELAPASAPAGAETSTRLWLKAVAASDEGKGLKADDALRARVRAVLVDPAQARLHADVLVNSAPEMVRALADTPAGRQAQVELFDPVLRRLEADASLSRGDRLSALVARLELARIERPRKDTQPGLPAALLAEVREHVAAVDREIADPYERQAVIPYAAYALERAGLLAEGEALLRANLARSHSPYYLMSQLGSLMRKQGRHDEALSWYAQAFDKSVGPATRLQWGAGYLQALVDLAPADGARIEAVATRLFDEAGRDEGAFHMRSANSMKRVGRALLAWNREGRHDASMKRLQTRLQATCRKVDAADGRRRGCEELLKPAASAG